MDSLLLAARLILTLVFVVAAATKVADRRGTLSAVGNFGLNPALATPVATFLPFVELAVAVALVVDRSAVWGAVGALLLLASFSAAIGLNLARGNAVDCHCFGQLHSEPIGPWTLARNGGLAILALFILVGAWSSAGNSSTHWFTLLSATQQILVVIGAGVLALLAAILWAVALLVHQNQQLVIRLKMLDAGLRGETMAAAETGAGRPLGTPAPEFALSRPNGEIVTPSSLLAAGRPVVLIFTEPNCAPCNSLMPEIAHWQDAHASDLEAVVVSAGTHEAAAAKEEEYGLRTVLVDSDRLLEKAYGVAGTPGAVVVRQDGTIGSPVALGPDPIRALVRQVLDLVSNGGSPPVDANGHKYAEADPRALFREFASPYIGTPAPRAVIHDLDGGPVDLTEFYDERTVFLFYSTTCFYSRQMVPLLRTWEVERAADAPNLVIVATGDQEEIRRSLSLEAPVLYDASADAFNAFGATGTPIGVLVEAGGTVTTRVVGAPMILALLNGELAWPTPDTLAAAG